MALNHLRELIKNKELETSVFTDFNFDIPTDRSLMGESK